MVSESEDIVPRKRRGVHVIDETNSRREQNLRTLRS
jgi:hypothetical protein